MHARTRSLYVMLVCCLVAAGWPLAAGGPDFKANLTSKETVPQVDSKAEGMAWFYFSENHRRLRYEIKLNGLAIQGTAGKGKGKKDTAFGAQIRHATTGSNGPVVLAFFGVPGQDDENMRIDPVVPTIGGVWDNNDRNEDTGSLRMLQMYDALCRGELYVSVQTSSYPTGALRGQIEPQPGSCD